MAMTDELPDSLFKLRLTGPLRKRLENEAAKRGLTLTAEILRRIDETFSDSAEKIAALEREVFDGERGNAALLEFCRYLDDDLKTIHGWVDDLRWRAGVLPENKD
ncbi:hypothetical protein [Acetobacter oryzifermentans]|uniref:Arc-like DNA binding domain-containing protein n=1 Tax=Acetobacter oryzifermentans TaxID=1633874 RepID=A0ABM6AH80_9PROT|nr:hypothetical protein [Acetobacter oryzifermentans]ANA12927.1 hypothetical protein WG31_01955 [Acetobacter oryzifermentans]